MKPLLLFMLAVCSTPLAAAPDWNPYARPSGEFDRRLHDAAFGVPGADRALEAWINAHPELAADRRAQGYNQLCVDYGVLTRYKARARACAAYVNAKRASGKALSADDDIGVALAFAAQPPIRAIGSAKVPLNWNALGCESVDVTVNGVTSSWFVDTGAQITVLIQSLADRLHVRPVAAAARVGTTTSDVVGKMGMIDRLRIGSAQVKNVPVLILPDAQLKVGNVHQIEGILGLQVLAAFGRVAWVDGGRALALGDLAPRAPAGAPRMYWDEEGLGVPVRTEKGIRGAFLDTGANVTDWRQAGVSLLDPKIVASAPDVVMHVGGAGGVVEVRQRQLSHLSFALGGLSVRLSRVPLEDGRKGSAAKLGMDTVSQFDMLVLDFQHMRIGGRLKTPAELRTDRRPGPTRRDVKIEKSYGGR